MKERRRYPSDSESIALDIQDLNYQCQQLRDTLVDLKDQVKATNVSLVAVNKEVSDLKLEAKDLRTLIELLKASIKPITTVFGIVGGALILAIFGGLLSLILK